jgi:Alginate lyase
MVPILSVPSEFSLNWKLWAAFAVASTLATVLVVLAVHSGDFDRDGRTDVLWYRSNPSEFQHPGLLSTQADLVAMRDVANSSTDSIVRRAYLDMASSTSSYRGSLRADVDPTDTVVYADPKNPSRPNPAYVPTPIARLNLRVETDTLVDPSCTQECGYWDYPDAADAYRDPHATYFYLLKWVVTGDSVWANKAQEIMNAWAATFEEVLYDCTGSEAEREVDYPGQCLRKTFVGAAWLAAEWANAGELLRHYDGGYPGWDTSEIAKFERMVRKLTYHARLGIDPVPAPGFANGNHGLAVVYAMIAAGVFLEDRALFELGVEKWKQILPEVIDSEGIMYEFAEREDCHHAQYSFIELSHAAEVAWHQGVDLYGFRLNGESRSRLELAMKKFGMLLRGAFVPEHLHQGDCNCDSPSRPENAKRPMPDGWEVAYRHYKARTDLNVNLASYEQALAVCAEMNPEVKSRHNFVTWTSLTHGSRSIP